MRLFLLAALSTALFAFEVVAEPLDALFPYEYIGNIDQSDFTEPSGLTYHPGRNSLFAVSDEGQIAEFALDGTLLQHAIFERTDFEGITCDPGSGLLYVAVEGAEKIIEFSVEGFDQMRTFRLDRAFEGQTLMAEGGQGIEGIAFADGAFYVANQGFSVDSGDDRSVVCRFRLPLDVAAPTGPVTAEHCFAPGMTDIAGLAFDSERQRLYLVSDSNNAFAETRADGHLLRLYAFPGQTQEGIALDSDGYLYIAQDAGGIVKIRWRR